MHKENHLELFNMAVPCIKQGLKIESQQRQLCWNFQFSVTMTKLVGGCHAVGSSSDALPIILFLSILIKVLLGIHVGNRTSFLILLIFARTWFHKIGNWISRVLIFVIICKKKKKEIKRTKFCNFVFVFILSTGHLSQLNKTYIFQSKIVNLQLPYIEPNEQDKTCLGKVHLIWQRGGEEDIETQSLKF